MYFEISIKLLTILTTLKRFNFSFYIYNLECGNTEWWNYKKPKLNTVQKW